MTTATTIDFDNVVLEKGSHADVSKGVCAMELVSWLAGEPHSDHPVCVSPVISAFVIRLNDAWDDVTRQKLKPYLKRMIGTANAASDPLRTWMALDWFCREYCPAWLDLAGIKDEAARIRALPPILSTVAVTSLE